MLEKIRLSVNKETEDIINNISQGIEDRLSAEPFLTRKFSDMIKQLEEKVASRPEWAGTIEKSLMSLMKLESAQIGKELQKLKVDVGSVVPRMDLTDTAVSEVAKILDATKTTVDLTIKDFNHAIGKVDTLLQAIKEDSDKTREATFHDLNLLQTCIAEQQAVIETLVGAIQEQSTQITRCERQLDALTKPWWKKLLGG